MIILEAIQKHSIATPCKSAVFEGEHTVTYAQLWDNIQRAAIYLSGMGNSGDRVILSGSKDVNFVYYYFGAHLAGMVAITVDPAISEKRLERIIDQTAPIGIFGSIACKSEATIGYIDLYEVTINRELSLPDENDMADILFTTGTTGQPKGVVLTHHNEAVAARNINTFIGNTSDDIELLALPVSHSFGLGRLRCIMAKGATIDLLGSFASMKKFFKEMEDKNITGFGMVPASWNYMRKFSGDRIGKFASQIKYIEIGSDFMPVGEKHKLMSLLPDTKICMHYGLTEASRSCFMTFADNLDHLETIGIPSPNVDARIYSESGLICDENEQGELCVKGEHVCSAYWGDKSGEYSNDFHNDYFRTGDWGYKDTDGRYYLVSRKKELINVGGKKLSPMEIEEVINEMPEVEESACIGIPDDVLGEVVKAFVVMKKGAYLDSNKLRAYVQSHIEPYKIPAVVEFIGEIPKTSSGKIQRLLLK